MPLVAWPALSPTGRARRFAKTCASAAAAHLRRYYARRILSIDLPLASSSTSLSR